MIKAALTTFVLTMMAIVSGCVVAPREGYHDGYRHDGYREGYYDRDHHRWYHEHQWRACEERDAHCR